MNLYQTLGVEPDATQDYIKSAYRKKAQAAHPDREGGDKVAFQAIQAAYDVLGDVDRRARYDQTGATTEAPDPRQTAILNVAQTLLQLMDQVDCDHTDLVKEAVSRAKKYISNIEQQKAQVKQDIAKKSKALTRLKSDKNPMVREIILNAIKEKQLMIERMDAEIAASQLMIEVMLECEYEVDKPKQPLTQQQVFNHLFPQHTAFYGT